MSMKSRISPTYIGRRKCSIALVRFIKGNGDFIINGKTGFNYLQEDPFAIQTVVAPLKLINLEKKYNIICSVRGGGICAQAEAIQLGIARALCSLTLPSYTDASHQTLQPSDTKQQVNDPKDQVEDSIQRSAFADDRRRPEVLVAQRQETVPGLQSSGQGAFTPPPETQGLGVSQVQKTNNRQGARPLLKEQGYLRRDSRIKERRKYGLKKARKAEQYSKR